MRNVWNRNNAVSIRAQEFLGNAQQETGVCAMFQDICKHYNIESSKAF